ncbi:septum site-determining protein MinD [Marinitoga sp. 1135]|uniref:Septum site-determining protein MinD n=1 Tax=Marinitoga piezophila (strain DSM 14283 / JCM 11233 / KA3) TaxID=443254 RepID=H2J5K6_MARPK|nr:MULTISPECIES: septum site-determining protein MinD [Marinitoga]AEX84992.1 septum site-determining protein MinD [Marinitoga piezophila KA3]APT75497.1 septum site-determining protein MinD [Marinitoga sp. 1137]NUU95220.1 septum site-determining protein MinD [Marinitoga sp. 1135]NUU97153.1 septum site-determining protein MinD [Marinitoga sp. 1138]
MKKSKVIVVTSGKGGVGKTTISANIGTSLALLGYDVCLIDADIGLKNLDLVLGLENRIVYTILDVVKGGKSPLEAVVKHKQLKKLNLLASSQIANKDMISPEDMKMIINELSKHFDYIIVDSPAGIERGFKNAVVAAQHAIVVTTPELTAISDADRVIGLLENEKYDEDSISLIVNRVKLHMVNRNEMLSPEDIRSGLAVELLGIVPDSEEIIIATNKGIPVTMEDESKISKIFMNIAKRISGEENPIENDLALLKESSKTGFKGFLQKIFGGR